MSSDDRRSSDGAVPRSLDMTYAIVEFYVTDIINTFAINVHVGTSIVRTSSHLSRSDPLLLSEFPAKRVLLEVIKTVVVFFRRGRSSVVSRSPVMCESSVRCPLHFQRVEYPSYSGYSLRILSQYVIGLGRPLSSYSPSSRYSTS